MKSTRREAMLLSLAAAGATMPANAKPQATATGDLPGGSCRASFRFASGIEGQRKADLGNGLYRNPVLAGDRPDPSVLKDGDEYYATFSSFSYYPGIPIWHSRDLVNWRPLATALTTDIGVVWALDIARYDGRYYIYIPALDPKDDKRPLKTWVIHAKSMAGPWSEPIDMKLDNYIDPGHILGEDGRRYLFFNGGMRVRLAADGLSADGPVEHVYAGWPIPEDWVIEGFALEGPKLLRKDGWFYMFWAQGGTAGPPTSHMVTVARSRSVNGPWENCPHNPIVRTRSACEPWWSRGHATAVQGPSDDWWLVYHGYENGMRTLGRQMLLEPLEWTNDGWPRAMGGDLSAPLAKPLGGQAVPHGVKLSGLEAGGFQTHLSFFSPKSGYTERAAIKDGVLQLTAEGGGPADCAPLTFVAGDTRYQIDVDVEIEPGAQGGLLLFYNEKFFCGLGLGDGKLHAWRLGQEERWPAGGSIAERRLQMRLVNDENIVSFFYSVDNGASWRKERSFEVGGYNHNVADGFLSLRPALYAAGKGKILFRSLVYRGLGSEMVQGTTIVQ